MWLSAFLAEQRLLKETPTRNTDSSSAFQHSGRQGQGRLKHVEVRLLVQDRIQQKRIHAAACLTEENIENMFTKLVTKAVSNELLSNCLFFG